MLALDSLADRSGVLQQARREGNRAPRYGQAAALAGWEGIDAQRRRRKDRDRRRMHHGTLPASR